MSWVSIVSRRNSWPVHPLNPVSQSPPEAASPLPTTPAERHCQALAQTGSSARYPSFLSIWETSTSASSLNSISFGKVTTLLSTVTPYPTPYMLFPCWCRGCPSVSSRWPVQCTLAWLPTTNTHTSWPNCFPHCWTLLCPSMGRLEKCSEFNAQTPHPCSGQPVTDKGCCLKTQLLPRVGTTEVHVLHRLPGPPVIASKAVITPSTFIVLTMCQTLF